MIINKENVFNEVEVLTGLIFKQRNGDFKEETMLEFVENVCKGLDEPLDPDVYTSETVEFVERINDLMGLLNKSSIQSEYDNDILVSYLRDLVVGMSYNFIKDIHEFTWL